MQAFTRYIYNEHSLNLQPDISITSSYFVICWLALSHLNKALLWLCPLVRFMIYNALCTFRWGSVEDELFTPCTRRSQEWKTYNQTLNFYLSWWGFPSRFLIIGGACWSQHHINASNKSWTFYGYESHCTPPIADPTGFTFGFNKEGAVSLNKF